MRKFDKSSKLDHVSYDVRGPALDEAMRMEEDGINILKLNIGNPAPFGFRTPDEVVQDMASQLRDTEGYPYSLLEALSLGTPVIVTDLPSNPDSQVVDGVNAISRRAAAATRVCERQCGGRVSQR